VTIIRSEFRFSLLLPLINDYSTSSFSRVLEKGGTLWIDPAVNVEASTNSPFGCGGDEKRSGIWQPFPVCKSMVGNGCVYRYPIAISVGFAARQAHHHPPRHSIAFTSISVHSVGQVRPHANRPNPRRRGQISIQQTALERGVSHASQRLSSRIFARWSWVRLKNLLTRDDANATFGYGYLLC